MTSVPLVRSRTGAANPIKAMRAPSLRMTKNHYNCKMETASARAIYKQRKIIVEPVFGQIKNSGFVASVFEEKKKSPLKRAFHTRIVNG